MTVVLGISEASSDSSACIIRDGVILAAIDEERVRRIKHCGGFPELAIKEVMRITGIKPAEIDRVSIGYKEILIPLYLKQSILNQRSVKLNPINNWRDKIGIQVFEKYYSWSHSSKFLKWVNYTSTQNMIKRSLSKLNIFAPVIRYDHHTCHAATAALTSGWERCLVITADGRGDGITSTVSIFENNELKKISESTVNSSLGNFYGGVTEAIGFRYGDGEGKTEALAAFGKETKAYEILKEFLKVDGLKIKGKLNPYYRNISILFKELLKDFKNEDSAYAAQRILDETITKLVKNAIKETGINKVAFAGGIFYNVKTNQQIYEIPEINDLYIYPASGDSGVSIGAALLDIHLNNGISNKRTKQVYYGASYSNEDIKSILSKTEFSYEYIDDIGAHVGSEILSKDVTVGWFRGRMEFGPRALGARSILISPKKLENKKKILSTIKKRPEFQPFCPSIMHESINDYVINPKKTEIPFMVLALEGTSKMVVEAPATTFIDKSIRVQDVKKEINSEFHSVISNFGKMSGTHVLLNTSFNKSGHAIVHTPEQALVDLTYGGLDYLVLENYLISKNK
jgi:carbamoyltransferase